MKCPKCGNIESKVIDSRSTDDFSSIRRRRECLECKHRFTTYEIIEHIPLIVIKKDGTREEFSREKLMNGIIKSCQKRPISMDTIEKMVSDIEKEALDKPVNEISSDALGEAVMDKLKDIDDVAYVRFASVYRQFKDINTFMDEMKSLLEKKDME